MSKKAVILLSGGLDSLTALAYAKNEGFECYTLHVKYGQRHASETIAAKQIAKKYLTKEFKEVSLDMSWLTTSALTNKDISIPIERSNGIPVTYVPARNTIMLTLALAWAETIEASDIFLGVNAVDYSGYPDCRPEFIEAFQKVANLGTKTGVENKNLKIHTPLINLTKSEIIKLGITLDVDYSTSVSCYQANSEGLACGQCDSCYLRKKGFVDAGVNDPTKYY